MFRSKKTREKVLESWSEYTERSTVLDLDKESEEIEEIEMYVTAFVKGSTKPKHRSILFKPELSKPLLGEVALGTVPEQQPPVKPVSKCDQVKAAFRKLGC